MDENRVEGTVREFAGKAQGATGDILGDTKTSVEGRVRDAAGQAQKAYGAASDQLRDVADDLGDRINEAPILAVLGALGIGFLIGKLSSR